MKAEELESGSPLETARALAGLGVRDLDGAQATALVFRTLASPTRVRIVGYLCQHGPTSRSQLTSVLGETWSTMEHHLTALIRDGFLTVRRQDITYRYELTDCLLSRIAALCKPA